MWNSRSPGVAGLWWSPSKPGMGCKPAGRGTEQPIPQRGADTHHAAQLALGSRKTTEHLRPLTSASSSRTASSARVHGQTRKIAASVSGDRIACGSAESGTRRIRRSRRSVE